MSRLTTAQRRRIPASGFALPKRRALPIIDSGHVRAAAGRLGQMKKRGSVTATEYKEARRRILEAEARFGIGPFRLQRDEAPPPSSRRGAGGYRFATTAALVRQERLGVPQAQRIVSDWSKYVDARRKEGRSASSTAEHIARFTRQHLARPYSRDPQQKARDPKRKPSFRRCPRGMEVQTLIFRGWTPARAQTWAREHDFRVTKIDQTPSSIRIRQRSPNDFVKSSFRTISMGTTVRAVVGCPRLLVKRDEAPQKRKSFDTKREAEIFQYRLLATGHGPGVTLSRATDGYAVRYPGKTPTYAVLSAKEWADAQRDPRGPRKPTSRRS